MEALVTTTHYGTKPGHFETSKIHFPTSEGVSEVSERVSGASERVSGASERVSGASERVNRRASGPVLTSRFLFDPDHSAAPVMAQPIRRTAMAIKSITWRH